MHLNLHIWQAHAYRLEHSISNVRAILQEEDTYVWLDVMENSGEIHGCLENAFGLHPLVIEDIFGEALQPKIEDYGDYIYMVLHGVRQDQEDPVDLGTSELDVVIGRRFLFTHHSLPLRSVDALRRELERNTKLLQRGPAYLAHAVIDRLTDHYLPVLERFEEAISNLENDLVDNPKQEHIGKIFGMKRSLLWLRRIGAYQRDILMRLSRGEFELIPEQMRAFYRDVYDHHVRITDMASDYREAVSALLDVHMSMTANRTNEIMRVLAVFSSIMMPVTFVAGVYGMNFEHMPELKWKYGYVYALSLMLLIAVGLLRWFRLRRWL